MPLVKRELEDIEREFLPFRDSESWVKGYDPTPIPHSVYEEIRDKWLKSISKSKGYRPQTGLSPVHEGAFPDSSKGDAHDETQEMRNISVGAGGEQISDVGATLDNE